MTRIIRPFAIAGLLALFLSTGPTPAFANGFGLFGPRQTTYISPVETIYAVPTYSSYVVPTTSVVSTSYLLPTSSVVYRPARYTLAPTVYRSASTALLPTSYLVGGSVLSPTRYYTTGGLLPTSYLSSSSLYPTSYLYPSSVVYPTRAVVSPSRIVYDAPVVETVEPIYIDRPSNSSGNSASRPQSDPPLSIERDRQDSNSGGSGRSPSLESQAMEPRPEPEPEPSPREREVEPEPLTPPDLPDPGNDGMPFPALPFDETRESMRPSFSGGLPGSTLAAVSRAIQGRVRDERSGRPIAGAIVTFSNRSPSFRDHQARTNERGEFRLNDFLPDGDWSIEISGTNDEAPTRTYPEITVMSGRIYDRSGRDYSKLVLDY